VSLLQFKAILFNIKLDISRVHASDRLACSFRVLQLTAQTCRFAQPFAGVARPLTSQPIRGLLGVTALDPGQVMMNNQRAQAATAQVGAQQARHVAIEAASNKQPHKKILVKIECGSSGQACGKLFRHCGASHTAAVSLGDGNCICLQAVALFLMYVHVDAVATERKPTLGNT
jgi:hypothetical protein